ncbi:hypothetical protein HMPREF0650_1658 [Hoylesella buccalis ATCC 35310]|uniref:Uncharacterized protein n=1 Tax=Hoylesella buccalis ATCC 35310 TaxID=679190 RepID=D1W3B4_9BACT|nr:hypothetical protein HMPREF0650_1658 [Hoylesella buccalis ATCC 35310]
MRKWLKIWFLFSLFFLFLIMFVFYKMMNKVIVIDELVNYQLVNLLTRKLVNYLN